MQPYQAASEKLRRSGETAVNIGKNVGLGLGAGIGSSFGSKLISGVSSLISNYVPENISKAGLSKLDPRFGTFLQGALDAGYTYDDLRQFIGEKINKSKQPAQEHRNIIEQYSPELHQYISQKLQEGLNPIEAAGHAKGTQRFNDVFKKLEKDHKVPISTLVQQIYGQEEQQNQQKSVQNQSLDPNIMQAYNKILSM